MMNTRKDVNGLYLIIVLTAFTAQLLVAFLSINGVKLHIVPNLLISQMIILLPGLLFFVVKNKEEYVYRPFKKINPVSFIPLIIFTELIMPMVAVINLLSQYFTRNEAMAVSGSIKSVPIWITLPIMGILGPVSEEFVFRGIIYNGLKEKSTRYITSAIISGLFFGLMHMNLNQFCYAFFLGIIFALVNECFESIWPSCICHMVINIQNVVMMYRLNDESVSEITPEYFVFILPEAIITMALAMLLLYGICAIEKKKDRFRLVFGGRKTKMKLRMEAYRLDEDKTLEIADEAGAGKRWLYLYGYLGIFICLFVMFGLEPFIKWLYIGRK